MDTDKIGLGHWQRQIVELASSGSFALRDMLAQYPEWADRSAIYRAASRLTRDDLRLIAYRGGVVLPVESETPPGTNPMVSLSLDFSQVRQEKQPSSDKIELPTHLIWRTTCFPCHPK